MKDWKRKLAIGGAVGVTILQGFSACTMQLPSIPAVIHPIGELTAATASGRPAEEERQQAPATAVSASQKQDAATVLQLQTEQGLQSMDLEAYLKGVLYAELPLSFPLEAKKALAVAARTFARKMIQSGEPLCDDPSCCQAWLPPCDDAEIEQAVRETDGEILCYAGDYIEATYFSCSGGMTEAASEVWGNDVPYLQAQPSPGEESAPRFSETVTLPIAAFREILLSAAPETDFSAEPLLTEEERTAGNGVRRMVIGGSSFTGIELRRLFALQSTNFTLQVDQRRASFTVLGYGHRVGLSQYGAKAMALQGSDYRQILSYYYPGTEIKRQS